MSQRRPASDVELLRLKDTPRPADLRKANRPVDRLLDLFR
jgi:hypothetical protein